MLKVPTPLKMQGKNPLNKVKAWRNDMEERMMRLEKRDAELEESVVDLEEENLQLQNGIQCSASCFHAHL